MADLSPIINFGGLASGMDTYPATPPASDETITVVAGQLAALRGG